MGPRAAESVPPATQDYKVVVQNSGRVDDLDRAAVVDIQRGQEAAEAAFVDAKDLFHKESR